MSSAFAAITARLPKGWGDLGRQVVVLVSVDLAYTFVRGIADGHKAVAMTHGQQVIDLERATHAPAATTSVIARRVFVVRRMGRVVRSRTASRINRA